MTVDTNVLRSHGAYRVADALGADLDTLVAAFDAMPVDIAGIRLRGVPGLDGWLVSNGRVGALAAECLGRNTRPVRAVLFDKTAATNWALGWHQDRTICVAGRADVAGYGPWTVKQGMHHVAPPFELLSRMVTVRVHLDAVDKYNAPLLIAPGSHLRGRIPVGRIAAEVERCEVETCLARAGDAWLYATPILHASDAAVRPARRRVLQVDYAAEDLPAPLEWLGI